MIGKPRADSGRIIESYAENRMEKTCAAEGVCLHRSMNSLATEGLPTRQGLPGVGKIIFVGASTGGTDAIKDFLLGIPADCPPILIVQHMPESFTASFARRLDALCAPRVVESQGNEKIEHGTVYVAPGHSHLLIRRGGSGLVTELAATPPVNRHRPSVDVLFDSAAACVGRKAVGVILTGMGKDGAQGLLRLRRAGARTFGQDEASCVVYGMPREAVAAGAAHEVLALLQIAPHLIERLRQTGGVAMHRV